MTLILYFASILSVMATGFWAFQVVTSFIYHRRMKNNPLKALSTTPKISVVLPSFNESYSLLNKTITSILQQKNVEVEVILVDDGSDKIVKLDDEFSKVQIIRNETNQGKRKSQMIGFKSAQNDWIATIDSDTILEENALSNLYNYIVTNKLSAASGTIYISNEKANLLTKLTSCMYWFSFFQERASQSLFNIVTCCSGALSMYKKEVILNNEKEFCEQTFLGSQCLAGDDRHLTSLFIINDHKVGWCPDSSAQTYSPPTITGFAKQQLRWIRSHVAEMSYILSNVRKCDWMYLFFMFKLPFKYFYSITVYLLSIASCVYYWSLVPLFVLFLCILSISIIKSLIAIFYTENLKFAYLIAYSLISFFVFTPFMLYGILTPQKNGWLTRE